jgi:hypothetical protein
MTTTMSNIENRHILVFVSSTFRDMQEEREYLREKVYQSFASSLQGVTWT